VRPAGPRPTIRVDGPSATLNLAVSEATRTVPSACPNENPAVGSVGHSRGETSRAQAQCFTAQASGTACTALARQGLGVRVPSSPQPRSPRSAGVTSIADDPAGLRLQHQLTSVCLHARPAPIVTSGDRSGRSEPATNGLEEPRGRATDLVWQARRNLLRNREDLSSEQFAKMWNTLLDEGKIGQTVLTAWIAREFLRNLWAVQYLGPDTPSAPLAPSFVPAPDQSAAVRPARLRRARRTT
jgi:hypothetical protein